MDNEETERLVPARRSAASCCSAGGTRSDVDAGAAQSTYLRSGISWAQAGGAPPPLPTVPPSGGEAGPATPGRALADGPHWRLVLNSPQDDVPSWSRAGATLPRTPSYPSIDPSSATATACNGSGLLAGLRRALHKLKQEVKALNYAVQDPRVGFLPRLLALLTIAYLLSPLDLLPDILPVIGLLDDLIIVPALLMVAVWLIPDEVMADARERAEHEPLRLRNNWGMACAIFAMWDALLLALVWWAIKRFGSLGLKHWQWCIVGGAALLLVVGEAAWSWVRHRQEVLQEAERAAARLARVRARARHAAYCAAAAERVWLDEPHTPLLPAVAVRVPAVAPVPMPAAAGGGKGLDSELEAALLAEEWEP